MFELRPFLVVAWLSTMSCNGGTLTEGGAQEEPAPGTIKASPVRIILGDLPFGGNDLVLDRQVEIQGLGNGVKIEDIDFSHAEGIQAIDRKNVAGGIAFTLKIDVREFGGNRPYGSLIKRAVRFETNSPDQPQVVVSISGWLGLNETRRDFNTFVVGGVERWKGWWATPNMAGAVIAALMPFFLGSSAWVWTNRNRGVRWLNMAIILILLSEGCAILVLLGYTYSRGAWIAYSAGSLVMIVFSGPLRRTAGLLFACFSIGLLCLPSGLERVASYTQVEQDLSIANRFKLWTGALQIMGDYPVVGTGTGHFNEVFERDYQTFDHTAQNSTAVSDFLTLGAEHGALLLGLGLGLAIFLVWESIRGALNDRSMLRTTLTASSVSMLAASCFSTLYFAPDYQWIFTVCFLGLFAFLARQIYKMRQNILQLRAMACRMAMSLAATFFVLGALIAASLRILPTRTTEVAFPIVAGGGVPFHLVEPRWNKAKGIIIYLSDPREDFSFLNHSTLRPLAARGWRLISPLPLEGEDAVNDFVELTHVRFPKDRIFIVGEENGGRQAWLAAAGPWARIINAGAGYGFLTSDLDATKGGSLPVEPFLIGHFMYDDVFSANPALCFRRSEASKNSVFTVLINQNSESHFSKDWMDWLKAIDTFFQRSGN